MTIRLDHTIVSATDKAASARVHRAIRARDHHWTPVIARAPHVVRHQLIWHRSIESDASVLRGGSPAQTGWMTACMAYWNPRADMRSRGDGGMSGVNGSFMG
jgi:hypothetical protein